MDNICNLCGNACNVDRSTYYGKCKINTLKIARYGLHFFEEPCISGTKGSGTIFFCGCPLSCVFCQNLPVSRNTVGKEITVDKLVDIMKKLEDMGANNINFVNPTHFVDDIKKALDIYRPNVPIVYNTHGFDSVDTIQKLKGYVDIYLPDLKYFDDNLAVKYSNAKNYFEVASKAILEMRKQASDTYFDNGMMRSGLIVRHLILPKGYPDSIEILKWIKANLPKTLVSIMSQYTPCNDLKNYKEIDRKLFSAEIERVQNVALELELDGFFQEKSSAKEQYIPVWDYDE